MWGWVAHCRALPAVRRSSRFRNPIYGRIKVAQEKVEKLDRVEKVEPRAENLEAAPANGAKPAPGAGDQRIRMNTASVKSSYCNMVNVTTTREEVVMNFGINESWDQGVAEYDVRLEHRIVMSPFAAKRLALMLGKLVTEYEGRYGELK